MATSSSRQWIPLQKQLVPRTKQASTVYQKNNERRHRETIDAALKHGYLKYLNEELILQSQTKDEAVLELQDVCRISLNRSHVQTLDDIALLSCTRLRICNLGSCYVRDISAFYGSINLLKLDVSNNQICQLPRSDFWSSLPSLRVLYLHGNELNGQEALARLNACNVLHILTLYDTPLSLMKNYRHYAVNSILSLRALDNHVISDEEIIENVKLSESFQSLTRHFNLQLYISPLKGMSYADELKSVYGVLLAVSRVLAKHSPVLFLQRYIRGWMVRKALAKSTNQRIRSIVVKARKMKAAQQPSSKPSDLQNGLVIATEMPLTKHPKASTLPNKTRLRSRPPPPPCSPQHLSAPSPYPVETRIDKKSSRAKYFLHINLRKLHQTVNEAELMEPEGVNKHFRSAFRKKPKKRANIVQNKAVEEKHLNTESDITEVDTAEANLKEEQTEKSNTQTDTVEVLGSPVRIQAHNKRPPLSQMREKDGIEIREAENEISIVVGKLREPQKIKNKSHNSAKDELLFTRAAATMTFSKLQSAEKTHFAAKVKSEKLKQKMDLIAKVRNERLSRKTNIEIFHRRVRDHVSDWKHDEDHRLEKQRAKLQDKRKSILLQQTEVYDLSIEKRLEKIQDQNLALKFGVQNTMVGGTLLREDRKSLKDNEAIEKRDLVQEAREQALEAQDMVKQYMEMRRMKFLQEGEEARKKLDSTMLEAASNRLIASRRKVNRAIARKQVAREAIAIAKEELRKCLHGPGEAMPASKGPPVITDSESQHLQFATNRMISEFQSPSHVRRISQEAHNTWQRGSKALNSIEKGHFPLIQSSTCETPLMYGILQPGTIKTSFAELPDIDSEITSSDTSIMIGNKDVSVR